MANGCEFSEMGGQDSSEAQKAPGAPPGLGTVTACRHRIGCQKQTADHRQRENMTESAKEAGIIAVLLEGLETQRLPRALELKEKLDKEEQLSDRDTEYLQQVLEDVERAKPFIDVQAEFHAFYARGVKRYEEIMATTLDPFTASRKINLLLRATEVSVCQYQEVRGKGDKPLN